MKVANLFAPLAAAGLVVGVVGCEFTKSSKPTKVQWMPDMADAPTVKAQEDYIDPPAHSVPVNGILYPKTAEESEKLMQNPVPMNDMYVSEGKAVYDKFCVACHGETGKGDNALQGKFPAPPDITGDIYKKRGDGFFFHRITFGSAIMPGYGHAIDAAERWKLVHYLRSLQK